MIATATFVLASPQAEAGKTAAQSFTLDATVVKASTLTVLGPLSFPAYDGTFTVSGTTQLQLDVPGCTAAAPCTVAVGFIGTGTGNGVFQMSNGTHTLNYNLCQAGTNCGTLFQSNYWGTSFSMTSQFYTYTLEGQIPSGQGGLPAAGTVMSQTISAYFEY
jgi:hypothetical protein